MTRLVVIGAGDVGGRVAARWVSEGHGEAVGLTRSTERHDALRAEGISPGTQEPSAVLQPGDRVLISVPGSSTLLAVIRDLPRLAERAVMTSSTGFYGSQGGVLGPETGPGQSDRAQAAAAAEQAFRDTTSDGVVLRFGGLYRAGRGPQEALRRRGHAPEGPAERPLPLIHVQDAASAALAALLHPDPPSTGVAVVEPIPTRRDFYTLACERLDLPAPTFSGQAPARRFDASAFRDQLLPEPTWPDWRAGLIHALRD